MAVLAMPKKETGGQSILKILVSGTCMGAHRTRTSLETLYRVLASSTVSCRTAVWNQPV